MGEFSRDLRRVVAPRRGSDLRTSGVPRRELASGLWRRVAHGWYLPADVQDTPAQRVVQAATVLPQGCLGGWAAAYVLGCDTLDGRDPWSGRLDPVPVLHVPGGGPLSADGTRCVRTRLADDEVVVRHGFRVTSPLRTAVDLACDAPSLTEAVVALDALLGARLLRLPLLTERLRRVGGVRGARQARAAGELCRPRTRSPWETRLRMFVLELGLPEPLVNVPVFDAQGRFVGRQTSSTRRPVSRWSSTAPTTGSDASTARTTSGRRTSRAPASSSSGRTTSTCGRTVPSWAVASGRAASGGSRVPGGNGAGAPRNRRAGEGSRPDESQQLAPDIGVSCAAC